MAYASAWEMSHCDDDRPASRVVFLAALGRRREEFGEVAFWYGAGN
jgi:hypothetical protein